LVPQQPRRHRRCRRGLAEPAVFPASRATLAGPAGTPGGMSWPVQLRAPGNRNCWARDAQAAPGGVVVGRQPTRLAPSSALPGIAWIAAPYSSAPLPGTLGPIILCCLGGGHRLWCLEARCEGGGGTRQHLVMADVEQAQPA